MLSRMAAGGLASRVRAVMPTAAAAAVSVQRLLQHQATTSSTRRRVAFTFKISTSPDLLEEYITHHAHVWPEMQAALQRQGPLRWWPACGGLRVVLMQGRC